MKDCTMFKGYRLDPFQREAIAHVEAGKSVIVAAPTGAGKTLVAEYAVDQAVAEGQQIVYTAPIKALSNQKYRDLSSQYPGQVGILTGDVSMDTNAPVLIMTTEILRNMIFDTPARLKGVSFVVFDEIHYLDDVERGTVWEEALIFCPQHIQLICLSATIPNLQELTAWMNTVREITIETVVCDERPVPLQHLFLVDGNLIEDLGDLKQAKGRRQGRRGRGGRRTAHDPLLELICDNRDVPCLYFAFNRAQCQRLAKRHQWMNLLSDGERKDILKLYDELAMSYGIETTSQFVAMRSLVSRGVAYHHAGMLPTMKVVVEELFTSRLLKLIFTTETFALGINMPARTVVFDELTKFNGIDFAPMMTREYYQMAGRAGRRGMDEAGHVYSKIESRRIGRGQVRRIVHGEPEPVTSQFNSCYATILNLYSVLGEDLYDTYDKSFHAFCSGKRRQRRAQELLRLKVKVLRKLGYIEATGLSAKGLCAARLYGYELIATELIFGGVLDELDTASLVVLCMAILFESRDHERLKRQDRNAATLLIPVMRGCLSHVHNLEAKLGLDAMTPDPDFGLSAAALAWAGGAGFDDVLRMTSVPEGHLVRHLRRTGLLLRQMAAACEGRVELQARLREAVRAVDRDVVNAERELRADGPATSERGTGVSALQ